MTDKHTKVLLYLILTGIIAFAVWNFFGGKDKNLQDAIVKMELARKSIDSANQKLNIVISNGDTVLKRNQDFKAYINSVENLIKLSDLEAIKREKAYFNSLGSLNKSIDALKKDLAKTNNKLPELENGVLK
ncbi:MAG: hypothetical protein Q8M15_16845 [Bacteroidota bacterium]|nr:hypothetical protein [Bacteroidota bacterium]